MVEPRGFEPLTSSLRTRRSPTELRPPPKVQRQQSLHENCGEWPPFRTRYLACQGDAVFPVVGLFETIRPATFAPGLQRTDTHARDTRHHSAGSADLHLALDRSRGPVLADRLQCSEHAQSS